MSAKDVFQWSGSVIDLSPAVMLPRLGASALSASHLSGGGRHYFVFVF